MESCGGVMGWSYCGEDSKGRPIGYGIDAICDEPGCSTKIHRGLAYACGDMHGDDEYSCEDYFCAAHRNGAVQKDDGRFAEVCSRCEAAWVAATGGLPEYRDDPAEPPE